MGYGAAALDGAAAICNPFSFTTAKKSSGNNSFLSSPTSLEFNYANGTLRISVTLPNLLQEGISAAFLEAPTFGYPENSPLSGILAAGKAIFTLPINSTMAGKSVPIKIYSASAAAKSDALTSTISIPQGVIEKSSVAPSSAPITKTKSTNSPKSQQKIPAAPTNPTYRLSGNQVLVSVTAPSATGATPSGALLIAPDLGFTPAHPVIGSLSGGKAIFRIVLSPSMAGKSAQVAIYLTNAAGSSAPLAGQVTLPPVIPGGASNSAPASQGTATIKCTKGSITRTFSGSTCPPGWK